MRQEQHGVSDLMNIQIISASINGTSQRIASYLAKFKTAYPSIVFNLEEPEASTVLPVLNKHEYDLAFIRDYGVDLNQYSSLEIVRDKLMVAVSKDHRFSTRKSLSLLELVDENFITYNKSTLVYELSVQACKSVALNRGCFMPRFAAQASLVS